eukprot:Skav202173  [mRNA]  locus=scaffold482:107245:108682:+ [translate_table: standard]
MSPARVSPGSGALQRSWPGRRWVSGPSEAAVDRWAEPRDRPLRGEPDRAAKDLFTIEQHLRHCKRTSVPWRGCALRPAQGAEFTWGYGSSS